MDGSKGGVEGTTHGVACLTHTCRPCRLSPDLDKYATKCQCHASYVTVGAVCYWACVETGVFVCGGPL